MQLTSASLLGLPADVTELELLNGLDVIPLPIGLRTITVIGLDNTLEEYFVFFEENSRVRVRWCSNTNHGDELLPNGEKRIKNYIVMRMGDTQNGSPDWMHVYTKNLAMLYARRTHVNCIEISVKLRRSFLYWLGEECRQFANNLEEEVVQFVTILPTMRIPIQWHPFIQHKTVQDVTLFILKLGCLCSEPLIWDSVSRKTPPNTQECIVFLDDVVECLVRVYQSL